MVSKLFKDTARKLKTSLIDDAAKATKHLDGLTPNQRVMYKHGKQSLGAAAVFIAGTSLLDNQMELADKNEARRQNKELEKGLEEKSEEEKKKREEYRHGVSFGHVDAGQIVIDMFNERTGHHKMGNSK